MSAELPSGSLSAPTWRCHGCKGCSKGLELTSPSSASSLPVCLPPEAQENEDTLPNSVPGALWGSRARSPDSPHLTSEVGSDPAIRPLVNAATCWKPRGPAASRQLLRQMLKEDSKKKARQMK